MFAEPTLPWNVHAGLRLLRFVKFGLALVDEIERTASLEIGSNSSTQVGYCLATNT